MTKAAIGRLSNLAGRNASEAWLHSVGIGILLCFTKLPYRRSAFADSEAGCTYHVRNAG